MQVRVKRKSVNDSNLDKYKANDSGNVNRLSAVGHRMKYG